MDYKKLTITTINRFADAGNMRVWLLLLGAVLVVSLAQTSAALTWKIVGMVTGTGVDVVVGGGRGAQSQLSPKSSAAAQRVLPTNELSLFGKAGRVEFASVPLQVNPQIAPETTLALLLKGIIAAEPRDRALAIIVEKGKDKQETVYGIGEKVPGNAVISDILVDRVILRRSGVFETLLLQHEDRANLPQTPVNRSLDSKEIVSLGDGVHWQIDNAYFNKRLGDISSLAKEIGVEVYKENNVQKGYRLVSARGSKLLRDMGLQPGDILYEVNGRQLKTIHDGLSVYQKMRSTAEVRVVLGRNGRRMTRVYEINSGG